MKLLLDTHVAVWVLFSPEKVTRAVLDLIAAADDQVYVSAVSILELAIKNSLGKRTAPFSGTEAVGRFEAGGFKLLNVTAQHAAAVDHLPLLHRDPFDRLLVAQALSEPLRLVTHDSKIAEYSDSVIHF